MSGARSSGPGNDRVGASPGAILDEFFDRERRRLDDRLIFEVRRQFGRYPPGCLVRLANRETAVVTAWSRGNAPPRYVISVLTPGGEPDPNPKVRLTSRPAFAIRHHTSFSPGELRKVLWGRVWSMMS